MALLSSLLLSLLILLLLLFIIIIITLRIKNRSENVPRSYEATEVSCKKSQKKKIEAPTGFKPMT